MNYFIKFCVELIINLTPAAYLMLGSFIVTITGLSNILPLTIVNVVGIIVSVKIVIYEIALKEFLYKDNNDRNFKMFTNIIILIIGMTLLSI